MNAFEVILACAADLHPLLVPGAARGRLHNLLVTPKVLRCEGIAFVLNPGGGAHSGDVAALDTCPRPEIDYPVGDAHRGFIVFYDDDGVALITEVKKR